ncbi:MAG: TIGR03936 family radical SAM-associated protein [Chloroflexota bacterium]
MVQPAASNNPQNELPRQRIRVTYEKGNAVKFISHLDEARLWERALRRADLPLLYKQGFNPQPFIQFAAALGVGITGVSELIDITFAPPLPLDEVTTRLKAKLPPGVIIHHVEEVPPKTTALQSLLIGADYTVLIHADPGEIPASLFEERITELLAQDEIWRERERKKKKYQYNLRPLVLELRYEGYDADAEEHKIFLRTQMRPGASGRPDEVVGALAFDDFARTLRRTRLYFSGIPEDEAVFDTYPVIDKEVITKMLPGQSRRGGKRRGRNRRDEQGDAQAATATETRQKPAGRSINERAGDEFV